MSVSINGGAFESAADHQATTDTTQALMNLFLAGARRAISPEQLAKMSERDIAGAALCAAIQGLLLTDEAKMLDMHSKAFTVGAAVAAIAAHNGAIRDVPVIHAFGEGYRAAAHQFGGLK